MSTYTFYRLKNYIYILLLENYILSVYYLCICDTILYVTSLWRYTYGKKIYW